MPLRVYQAKLLPTLIQSHHDTLYKIAQANNISLSDLSTINPGVDPKKLLTGQLILLAGITYPPDGAVLPYGEDSHFYKWEWVHVLCFGDDSLQ